MKTKLLFITLFIAFTSGCIKLEVGSVVSDTVDASKGLYKTIKRRTNGEEVREYSHTITIAADDKGIERIRECKNQLAQIIHQSGYKIRDVLAESSKIITNDNNEANYLECMQRVVVKEID